MQVMTPTIWMVLGGLAIAVLAGMWVVSRILKRLGPKESIEDTDFYRNE